MDDLACTHILKLHILIRTQFELHLFKGDSREIHYVRLGHRRAAFCIDAMRNNLRLALVVEVDLDGVDNDGTSVQFTHNHRDALLVLH